MHLEIAEKLELMKITNSVANNTPKIPTVEDTDINDDQADPLNEDASNISFDNFEKMQQKKEKEKIYLTQNEKYKSL